jgi:hypothetical protein
MHRLCQHQLEQRFPTRSHQDSWFRVAYTAQYRTLLMLERPIVLRANHLVSVNTPPLRQKSALTHKVARSRLKASSLSVAFNARHERSTTQHLHHRFFRTGYPAAECRGRYQTRTPQIQIVGLSAARGKAIHERIRAEPLNCGFKVPDQRITINLSPADLPMDLPGYDLPIGLALLARSQQLPKSDAGGSTSRRWHFGQSCGGRTGSSNGPWVVVTMKLNGRGQAASILYGH